jgi:hypothetical protein
MEKEPLRKKDEGERVKLGEWSRNLLEKELYP